MKVILLLLVFTISTSIYAQKSEVLEKFEEYQFSENFLTESLKDADATHSFDAKITTIDGTDTKIEEAKFDPKNEIGERWILISVNGNTPSKKELRQFNKSHNTTQPEINGRVDENSWGIESDDSDYLVISFKYDKSTLPKKYDFLGDCKGLAFFNKQTKMLEKAEFVNEQPLKVKIFNVTKLDMIVTYTFNEEEQTYFILEEELKMEVKLLGQLVDIDDITHFSNYKKQ